MRKFIIGLSGLLLIAFVVIKVANAQTSQQEVKKNATEQKMDCGKCPSADACAQKSDSKTADGKKCDPAKCKEAKCNQANSKEKSDSKGDMKSCDTTKCSKMIKK
ncbi:MAG TPA: hypothetical protein VF346_03890 [Bacteroidales bacterium]